MLKNFNIFAGSRRIAALMACGMASVFIVDFFSSSYISVFVTVPSFGIQPYLSESCDSADAAREYITRELPSGQSVSITLCFPASRANNGAMLIPYESAPNNMVNMAPTYSPEVYRYTRSVAGNFSLNEELQTKIETIVSAKTRKKIAESLEIIAYSLVGLLLFTKAIGWVVRGFLGIPNGQDKKPISES